MKRFANILLLAEGECWQDTPLLRAVSLAEHNQADLTVISPMNFPDNIRLPDDIDYTSFKNTIVDDRQDQLAEIVASVSADVAIKVKVIEGGIFPGIIHEVLRNDYDLVMKCIDQTDSLQNRIFGSTDMRLLRKCPCPVWIIPANEKAKYQRIFAAIDVETGIGDEIMNGLNKQILEISSSLALSDFSELHIVHTWTAPGESFLRGPRFGPKGNSAVDDLVEQQRVVHVTKMDEIMEEFATNLSQDTLEYLKPQVHIVKGEADKVIPSLTVEKKADLVVMGTVARTGMQGFIMGNTAENILNSIGCSVLAVKPPGFITPVTL